MKRAAKVDDYSVIALDKFIQATRDSGYKGTTSAISELIDNAIQAGSTRISITVSKSEADSSYPITISVLDDGCGMDPETLRQALRFGGSSRFNDRSGLGRFGMGLPNSSLSQTRRVEVYSWQNPGSVFFSYLDVDEIAEGKMTNVPPPKRSSLPTLAQKVESSSGTLVLWSRCDRLDHRRVSTIVRKLEKFLGRACRYPLWDGLEILINEVPTCTFDPLYLHEKSRTTGAHLYGEPLIYEVRAPSSGMLSDAVGVVKVSFSELPVHEWHEFSNEKKRELGISKGAGISVVRAGREVDYGWFFLPGKRQENYDDWWRCEIQFDPVLDEVFGITHTKQQIRPTDYLLDILSPDIEVTAKALNGRVRKAHLALKTETRFLDAIQLATERDKRLKPLPGRNGSGKGHPTFQELAERHPVLKKEMAPEAQVTTTYDIVEDDLRDSSFFNFSSENGRLVLVLNPDHPFYRKIYKPLCDSHSEQDKNFRLLLELMLLAAARSEASIEKTKERELLSRFRHEWSNTIATFFNR